MSTDTTPTAPSGDPNAEVLRLAETAIAAADEAKRRFEDLSAKAVLAAAATPPPTATGDSALRAEIDVLKSRMASLDTIEERSKKDGLDARVAHVRAMGLAITLSDADVLKLSPEVDPKTPEGRAAIEAWRANNGGLFRSRGPSPEAVQAAQQPRIDALRARKTRLINPEAAFSRRVRS